MRVEIITKTESDEVKCNKIYIVEKKSKKNKNLIFPVCNSNKF